MDPLDKDQDANVSCFASDSNDVDVAASHDDPGIPNQLNPDREVGDGVDAVGETKQDSPGATYFKMWLWVPGLPAVGFLATVVVRGRTSSADLYFVVAAIACLPAQALAWSWASHRWLRWKDWRLISTMSLTVVALTSLIAATIVRADPARDRTYRVGIGPNDIVATDDALWVSDAIDQVVYRLPNDREQSIMPIPVAGAFELATDGSSVWVSQEVAEGGGSAASVTRLRPDGSQARTYELPARAADIAATNEWLWLAFIETGSVGRIDATSGELETFAVGDAPASLAIDSGSVWVTDVGSNTVVRLDAATGNVEERLATDAEPLGIDAENGQVWIANADADLITYYDSKHGVPTKFRVPAVPTDIAIDEGTLWIVSREAHTLIAVDAWSGESKREIPLAGRANRLEVVGSDVFVAVPDGGVVQRFAAVSPASR